MKFHILEINFVKLLNIAREVWEILCGCDKKVVS